LLVAGAEKTPSPAIHPPEPKAIPLVIEPNTDVIQGTLDMLILKTVSLAPLHGYGITQRIEQVSGNVFKVNPGSLLTALKRLERSGWLDSEWGRTENARRAKYYSITAKGMRRLEAETADWRRRSAAVGRLLGAEG
jgi:transcriptional regulator